MNPNEIAYFGVAPGSGSGHHPSSNWWLGYNKVDGREVDGGFLPAATSHGYAALHHIRVGGEAVRDKKGNEIVEEIEETIKEWEDGVPVYRKQKTQRKVVDDNTMQIAKAFRQWLSEQD